ncbi:GNAT family N-acetyltransferase [Reinekea marinisedimentorum]|uniref:Acetyltransferase (GNAT) family protein n=1 Tax=Reinekea marinisedimentorum TaxID=230495 RepID=A0A4R3I4D2_9GAMM|nr:GNAT family N-acetyltransferase [Reinekea marinisedimentorum]TCS39741.1 acetyltransferase (GNAT) family protein [Reinekea marinisedimentorum]
MKIKTLTWQQTIDIRHQVLWPHKDPSFCKVEGDETGRHYGAQVDGCIVSVASVYIHGDRARLRKFATVAAFQKQGIGTAMLKHMLAEVSQIPNVNLFWFDARESAIAFYRKFDFKTEGERFFKSDIPYFKMTKKL